MSTNSGIPGQVFITLISLIFGLIMMIIALSNLTKKFEDQYDKKTKDIAIVYNDKFEKEVTRYIEKKDAVGDYEKLQEELNDYKENIMLYAAEYYDWMGKSKDIKEILRESALFFLLGGLLSLPAYALYEYIDVSLGCFLASFVILFYGFAVWNVIRYIKEEGYIDEKYSEYELRRIKDW